jgi:hypothetical protein
MIRIITWLPGSYKGASFFIFIFLRDKSRLSDFRLINHETIHFYQQLEMIFVLNWILYGLFYLAGRVKGESHDEAYRSNPFEREAYDNDQDLTYIFKRKPFAWIKYI